MRLIFFLHSDPLTNILKVRYETFVARPQEEMSRINRAVGLRQAGDGSIALPLSRYTLTAPDAEKWKRNERLISESWHLVEEQAHRLDDFMKDVG